jgi:hypothetical protein
MAPSLAIIIPVIFAVFFIRATIFNVRRCYCQRRMRRAPRVITEADRAEFERKRIESMNRETGLCQTQEADDSKGMRVWLSRWIENGRLRHRVLYTHHTKYELRLPPSTTVWKC